MYQIVYTNTAAATRMADLIPRHLMTNPLEDRLPLVVDIDGRPDIVLAKFMTANHWLSRNTCEQYANSLVRLANFLFYASGCRLIDATERNIDEYRLYRLQNQPSPITSYSFKPEAAAIRKFYRWCTSSGLMQTAPVVSIDRSGRDNLSVRSLRSHEVRYVPRSQYRLFLKTAEAEHRPHNFRSLDARNCAVIRSLVASGARLSELVYLLAIELDAAVPSGGVRGVEVEATAKYKRRRTIYYPPYSLEAVEKYRKIERGHIIDKRQDYLNSVRDELFIADRYDPVQASISGHWGGLEDSETYFVRNLPISHRRKIVRIHSDGYIEPLGLFLSQTTALPMTRPAWEQVFARISNQAIARNTGLGNRKVRPHDFRHTFAVNYLSERLRMQSMEMNGSKNGFERPFRDPLVDLKERLGHSSIAQTIKYLRYVEDYEQHIETAVATYAGVAGAEEE